MISRPYSLLAAGVLAAAAPSQITISQQNMSVSSGPASASSNLPRSFDLMSDALAIDQGYEHWWFYRIAGDASESAMRSTGGVVEGVYTGNQHGDRDFADLDARGLLKASHDMDVYSSGPASGVLVSRVTLMNISNAPVTLDLFAYTDIDVSGTFSDDMCTGTTDRHLVTDNSGILIDIRALGADRSDVAAYPAIRDALSDGNVNDLTNAVPPFTGDYTGAFQWSSQTLQPFEERTYIVEIAVDTAANAVPVVRNYGAGNGSVFQVHATDLPLQDNAQPRSFNVRMKGGVPNAFYRVASALQSWPAPPFIPGIDLWLEPTLFIGIYDGFFDANGNGSQAFFIPSSPYYNGFEAFFQCFYVDANAPNGFAYYTPGMAIRIGKL